VLTCDVLPATCHVPRATCDVLNVLREVNSDFVPSSPKPPLRTAEVIAVGSELLGSHRLDTNSLFIADQLASLGIELRAKAVVGDDLARIADLCQQALTRSDLVVLTGGLGPTDDDLTRDAVSAVLGLPLIEQPAITEVIEKRFARRGLKMPDINRRQAQVLQGATVLDNPNGTAPGQFVEHGDKVVVLLPGPPRELQPMLNALCDGLLGARASDERIYRTSFFVTGRGESHVDEKLQPVYSTWKTATPPIETTILATPGQIELHLSTRSPDGAAAEKALGAARDQLVSLLVPDVFSIDGRSMEQVVGDLLRERRLTIAAAESCTGGLLLSRLTDIPGSSDYVLGGAVLYSNDVKTTLAGVPEEMIAAHGAVSEPVALALAEGIRDRTSADIAVGITGIAGPGGGTPQKPVGTVAIAVLSPNNPARVRTFSLLGGRTMIKFNATQAALEMVRRAVVG
jgi:nicotinamide-nucleotide amidase